MATPEKYKHINFVPPAGVRKEAEYGLKLRREHGRGGTAVGIARARDLANGAKLSPSTIRRMKAFFDRHASDSNAEGFRKGEKGYPSNGVIANKLWGGPSGYSWAKKVVAQMEAADARSYSTETETRSIEVKETPMQNVERRYLSTSGTENATEGALNVEHRADPETGEKRTYLIGYAAKFGTDSLMLGDFIEQISPSAFEIVEKGKDEEGRPLETRGLFNHDPNHLIGRYPTTMKLKVDKIGLKYEILLPESRKDLAEMVSRGDLKGSSFSFVVAEGGEKWTRSGGKSRRLVTKIKSLLDCGPVTYPAYRDSSVAVAKRSYEQFVSTPPAPKVDLAAEVRKCQEFIGERRGFCPTGVGGGIDNSCGSSGAPRVMMAPDKDAGGGGGIKSLEQERLDLAGKSGPATKPPSGDRPKSLEQERLEAAGAWDPRVDPYVDVPYDGQGHGGFVMDQKKDVTIPGTNQKTSINVDDPEHVKQFVVLAAKAAGMTPDEFMKSKNFGGVIDNLTPHDKVKLFGGTAKQYGRKDARPGGWGSKENDELAKRIGATLRAANIRGETLATAVREFSKSRGLDPSNEMYSGLKTFKRDPGEFMEWARKRLDYYFDNRRRSLDPHEVVAATLRFLKDRR